PSGGNTVEVRVFSWAPLLKKKPSPGSVFSFQQHTRPCQRFALQVNRQKKAAHRAAFSFQPQPQA
ncbi:hypothetical protein, partial [Stutzerimonas balearica]|uniref:hypothetical protein n=1 Tax=Stutzerimonas balearica TaxID=74829 RepID=UPI0028A9D387